MRQQPYGFSLRKGTSAMRVMKLVSTSTIGHSRRRADSLSSKGDVSVEVPAAGTEERLTASGTHYSVQRCWRCLIVTYPCRMWSRRRIRTKHALPSGLDRTWTQTPGCNWGRRAWGGPEAMESIAPSERRPKRCSALCTTALQRCSGLGILLIRELRSACPSGSPASCL